MTSKVIEWSPFSTNPNISSSVILVTLSTTSGLLITLKLSSFLPKELSLLGFQDSITTRGFSLSSGCSSISAWVADVMYLMSHSRNSYFTLKISWMGRYTPMTSPPLRRAASQVTLHRRPLAGVPRLYIQLPPHTAPLGKCHAILNYIMKPECVLFWFFTLTHTQQTSFHN